MPPRRALLATEQRQGLVGLGMEPTARLFRDTLPAVGPTQDMPSEVRAPGFEMPALSPKAITQARNLAPGASMSPSKVRDTGWSRERVPCRRGSLLSCSANAGGPGTRGLYVGPRQPGEGRDVGTVLRMACAVGQLGLCAQNAGGPCMARAGTAAPVLQCGKEGPWEVSRHGPRRVPRGGWFLLFPAWV